MASEGQDAFDKRLKDMFPDRVPVTPGAEMGMICKGTYDDFIKEEFSASQALYLTAALLTGNPGLPPNRG
jgi:hypothetical protein